MDAIKLQSRILSKISTALNEFHRTELDPQKLLNLSKQLSKICSVYYSSEQNAVKELQTLEHLKAIIKIMVKKNTLQLYELICALWYCGKIADSQGAHFSFSSFVRIFEIILNIRLTGIFHKREQLIRKKSSTPFLDKLKSVLIENLKKLPSEQ